MGLWKGLEDPDFLQQLLGAVDPQEVDHSDSDAPAQHVEELQGKEKEKKHISVHIQYTPQTNMG